MASLSLSMPNAVILGDLDGSRLCEECSAEYATRKVRVIVASRAFDTIRRLCDSCSQSIGAVADDSEEEEAAPPAADNVSLYLDDYGDVRLRNVRGRLDYDSDGDLAVLKDLYLTWMQDHEYIILKETIEEGDKRSTSWRAIKVPKRGNDVANRILQQRLAPLRKVFLESDFSLDHEHTCLLYLTLTYDTKRCTRTEAWQTIGKDLNRFFSRVRKAHGKIGVFRAWESFDNGYPHVHMLLYFHETSFTYFTHEVPYHDRRGNERVKETYRIVNFQRKKIADAWHSHVDIQAVTGNGLDRLDDVLSYIVKYKDEHVDPSQWNNKELLTMVATWYFRLRQFGVSAGFFGDLTKGSCVIQTDPLQTDLEGNVITFVTWEFMGMIKGRNARIPPEVWDKTFDKRPPWMSDVFMPTNLRNASAPSILKGMGFK